MGGLEIAIMLFGLADLAIKAAKSNGLISDAMQPWLSYTDAALHFGTEGMKILAAVKAGNTDYDNLTEEQIRTLLMPPSWEGPDGIEAMAKAELGMI